MDLTLKDVCEMLNVSEDVLGDLVREGKIPHYRLNQEYRFNRVEIEEWMLRSSSLTETPFRRKKTSGTQTFSLYRALHRGGMLFGLPSDVDRKDKLAVIRSVAQMLSDRFSWDSGVVTEMLLERERLMPTSLNHGIAVPHTRDFLLNTHFDIVCALFLPEPIEYGALDQQPVHTLFFLFACEDKRHLHLLAKIAFLSRQPALLEQLRQTNQPEKSLELIRQWEARIGAS